MWSAKKIISKLMVFGLALGLLSVPAPEKLTAAEGDKNVTLGAQAVKPNSGSKWEQDGTTVYFGKYNGVATQYRVLKSENGKILLDCNSILYGSKIGHALPKTGKWDGSQLQSELNGSTFYSNTDVFNTVEKNAIALTSNEAKDYYAYQTGVGTTGGRCVDYATNDYVFLLSAQEVHDLYNERADKAKDGNWWTRSNHQTATQAVYVDTSGTLLAAASITENGVSPAFNINESAVAFATAPATVRSSFNTTYTASEDSWVLTLYDGSGFNASLSGTSSVNAGGSIGVRVNSLASGNTNTYNQISAMLVDQNGIVAAYGKVSSNVSTGNIDVNIPSGVAEGNYTLKVFAESVPVALNSSSYASNMSDMNITVGKGSGSGDSGNGGSGSGSGDSGNGGSGSNSGDSGNTGSDGYKDGWNTIDGVDYWYENGVRQGLEGRGKEIFDKDSDAWYWLDSVQNGAKTVNKDVYQESAAGICGDYDGTDANGNAIKVGKWVRYDSQGHMIKGWCSGKDADAKAISSPAEGNGADVYYFDPIYGTMIKGYYTINGVEYYFDVNTGIFERATGIVGLDGYTGWKTLNGCEYWFEDGFRQGYSKDSSYRGKEIYDPGTSAWYWLDNVDDGKKAVSKDVYQESLAGDWGDKYNDKGEKIGKWVRYDAEGHMVKGWQYVGKDTYYFDLTYGTMAKGTAVIDGITYTFDSSNGKKQ